MPKGKHLTLDVRRSIQIGLGERGMCYINMGNAVRFDDKKILKSALEESRKDPLEVHLRFKLQPK